LPVVVEAAQEAGYKQLAVVGAPPVSAYESAGAGLRASQLLGALLAPPDVVALRFTLRCHSNVPTDCLAPAAGVTTSELLRDLQATSGGHRPLGFLRRPPR
jgi:hypothetical protein